MLGTTMAQILTGVRSHFSDNENRLYKMSKYLSLVKREVDPDIAATNGRGESAPLCPTFMLNHTFTVKREDEIDTDEGIAHGGTTRWGKQSFAIRKDFIDTLAEKRGTA